MPSTVLSATLSSGTATSDAKEFEPGIVYVNVDATGMTGSVIIEVSPDGTTFHTVGDGTYTDDSAVQVLNHAGGFVRFTSSISGGSAAVKAWQDPRTT